MEKWKEIQGTDGRYSISSLGNVRNNKSGRILKEDVSQRGYSRVGIIFNGKRIHLRVHRLVALAFIPNPSKLPQVDHLNGNKKDNRVDNLRWVDNWTNSQNRASITHKNPVIVTTATGSVEYFESQTSAAEFLGVSRYGVMAVCNGTQKTTGGAKIELI